MFIVKPLRGDINSGVDRPLSVCHRPARRTAILGLIIGSPTPHFNP